MASGMTASGSIQPDYPEPLWVQVFDRIKSEIHDGALKPGTRIPPERELCRELGVSRVTLRKALRRLVDEGAISAAHGRGWYVAESPQREDWPNELESFSETARRMGLTATAKVLHAAVIPANLDLADELGVAPGTPVFILERVRLLDGVPIALDLTQIPAALVPGFGDVDFETASLYRELESAGLAFTGASSTIEAQPADEHMAHELDLEMGRPILKLSQIVVDAADRPLFASTIRYRGDRYRLRTSFARKSASTRDTSGRAHGN